jgi:ferric-dicitrate binding protein FerR (iron transport regulator)
MEPNDHIAIIVAKKLSGEATEPELEDLQNWLDADPINALAYDQMIKVWEKSQATLLHQQFDIAAAWTIVEENISKLASKRRRIVISLPWVKRLAVAAAILIVFGGAWYYWSSSSRNWQTFSAIDSNRTFNLPDGSTVLLRKGSSLEAPSEFKGDKREVRLKGEGFFQVQHDANHPFLVNTEYLVVTDLGTSFLVKSEAVAGKVVVASGKVNVQSKEEPGNEVTITAGEYVLLSNKDHVTGTVIDSNYLSWNTGLLNFKDTPLENVLDEVGHYYNVTVDLASDQEAGFSKIKLTVHFDNQPLGQVLEEISLLSGLQIKNENNTIIFYKK